MYYCIIIVIINFVCMSFDVWYCFISCHILTVSIRYSVRTEGQVHTGTVRCMGTIEILSSVLLVRVKPVHTSCIGISYL